LLCIILAYLPDIAAQFAAFAGWRYAGSFTHSIGFAVAAAGAAGLLAVCLSGSFRSMAALTLLSVLAHNLMDLGQGPGSRLFGWPLYLQPIDSLSLIPRSLVGESAVLGVAAGVALLVTHRWQPRRSWDRTSRPVVSSTPRDLLSAGVSAAMLLLAATTHYLRDQRESNLVEARRLAAGHQYAETLEMLDRAGAWPSTARPGRIEHLRAEAYAGLGDLHSAERLYREAYELDPDYFWSVGDLAVFYARSDLPRDERVRLVEPYVRRLQQDFATHPALEVFLARINRHLADSTDVDR
jgi:tetratricopeptide (TPR) repeat protein